MNGLEVERLTVGDYVRYVLSGGVAVLIVGLVYPSVSAPAWNGLRGEQAVLLGFVVPVVGITLYGLHRALLHPMLLRLVLLLLAARGPITDKRGLKNPFKPTAVELALVRKRWFDKTPSGANRWAAQVHSLYCTAWAIGAVWVSGPSILGAPEHPAWLGLFGVFLVGAILEDVRLSYTVVVEELGRQT